MIKCKRRAKVASHKSAQNSSLVLGFTVTGTQGTHPANTRFGQDSVLSLNFLDTVEEIRGAGTGGKVSQDLAHCNKRGNNHKTWG